MSSRRGQAMVLFALLLPLALLPAAAYGAEVSLIAARQARLAEVAAVVALDAAQQLDVASLRAGGGFAVAASAATAAAASEVAALEPAAALSSVAVAGPSVSVTITERVPLRLATFVRGASVRLTATAAASIATGLGAPS